MSINTLAKAENFMKNLQKGDVITIKNNLIVDKKYNRFIGDSKNSCGLGYLDLMKKSAQNTVFAILDPDTGFGDFFSFLTESEKEGMVFYFTPAFVKTLNGKRV